MVLSECWVLNCDWANVKPSDGVNEKNRMLLF